MDRKKANGVASVPTPDELSAAEEDWALSTEFQWNDHSYSAHLYEAEPGLYFVQVEDLGAYQVAVSTSHKFRMTDPILESVRVCPNGGLMATVVNQTKNRLVAKELIPLERNKFYTPPFEEEPVEG